MMNKCIICECEKSGVNPYAPVCNECEKKTPMAICTPHLFINSTASLIASAAIQRFEELNVQAA